MTKQPNSALRALLLLMIVASSAFAQGFSISATPNPVNVKENIIFVIQPRPSATNPVSVRVVAAGNNYDLDGKAVPVSQIPPDGFGPTVEGIITRQAPTSFSGQFLYTVYDKNNAPSGSVTVTVLGPGPVVTPPCTLTINNPGSLRVGQSTAFGVTGSAGCSFPSLTWSANNGAFSGNVLTPLNAGSVTVSVSGTDQLGRAVPLVSAPFPVAAAPVICTLTATGPTQGTVGQVASFSAFSPNCAGQISNLRMTVNGVQQGGLSFTPQAPGGYTIIVYADSPNGTLSTTIGFTATAAPQVACTLTATGPTQGTVGQVASFSAFSPNCAGQISNLRMTVNGVQQGGLSFTPQAPGGYTIIVYADSPNGTLSATIGFTATSVQPPFSCSINVGYSGLAQVGQTITFGYTVSGCNLDGRPFMVVAGGPGQKVGEYGVQLTGAGRVTVNFTGTSDGRQVYGSLSVDVNATNPSCNISSISANPNPVEAGKSVAISYAANCGLPDALLTLTRRSDNTVAYGPYQFGNTTAITLPGLAAGVYTVTVAGNGGQVRSETVLTVTAAPPTRPCNATVVPVTTRARPFANFLFKINAGDGVRILGTKFKIQRPDGSFAREETTKAGETEFTYTLFSKPGTWLVTPEVQTDCGVVTGTPISVGIEDETGRVPLPMCPVSLTIYREGTSQRLVAFPSQTPQGYTRLVPYADENGKPYEDFRIDVEVPFGTPALTSQSLFLTGGKFPIVLRNENPRNTGFTSFSLGSLAFVTDGRNPSNGTFAPILVEGNLKIEVGDRSDCRGGELDPFQFYVSDGRPTDEKRPRFVVQFGTFTPGTQVDTSDTNAFPNRGRVGDEYTIAHVGTTTIKSSLDLVKVQLPSGQVVELKANSNGFFTSRGMIAGHYKVFGWDHDGVELSTEFWLY